MSKNRPTPLSKIDEVHSARAGSHFNQNDNGFYVTCNVGSSTIHFLIDCGATTSLISDSKMKEIGNHRSFVLRPMASVLKTVNGEPMSVSGSVDLVVEMTSERFDMSFVVCDIEADGILGQDFLKQYVDSINYKHSCLLIGNKTIPLWTGGRANQICRVDIQHTIKIPAHTRKQVTVKIPQREHLAQLGCVEPSIELMAKREVCVMGGIVDTTSS